MLDEVRELTAAEMKQSCERDNPILIEAPPASGKTLNAIRLAATTEYNVTYLAGRTDLYEQAEEIADEYDKIDYEQVPSPHRDCPTFQNENDGDVEKARRLYAKGVSGRDIHYMGWETVYMPCQDPSTNSECDYITKLDKVNSEERLEEIDLLIGNHQHAYRDSYLRDRIVIFDEFNPDPFLTRYPSKRTEVDLHDDPSELLPTFLEAVGELPLTDVTDLIEARVGDTQAKEVAMRWFKKHGADQNTGQEVLSVSPNRYDTTDVLAPLLACSLLHMEEVGSGVELAYEPEQWEAVGIGSGVRCIRNRNSGEILLLQPPPSIDAAKQVIGIDALPTKRLWDIVYDCEFERKQIISRDQLDTYLTDCLNIEIVQLGNGMNHYSSGLVSPRDGKRFKAVRVLEEAPFPLITRKKALEQYRHEPWFQDCIKSDATTSETNGDSKHTSFQAKHYATVLSSNDFADQSFGVVSGSPYPGDDVIKRWAALCEESTKPRRSADGNLEKFTGFGETVYRHFTHHQVFQAILRFGRDQELHDEDTTVYVNTHALPEWLSTTTELTVKDRRNEPLQVLVIEELIRATKDEARIDQQTVSTLHAAVTEVLENDSPRSLTSTNRVTKKHIRNTLQKEEFQDAVTVSPDAGRHSADLYTWTGNEFLYPCSVSDSADHLLILDSSVYFLKINGES